MSRHVNIPPVEGGGGSDTWANNVADLMLAAVPALTRFEYFKIGFNSLGAAVGAVTSDALIPGGGMTTPNATFKAFGTSLIQLPKTTPWSLGVRAKLLGPTVARQSHVGLFNAATTRAVQIFVNPTTDATHYVLSVGDATPLNIAATTLADAAWHDFVITFDLTTLALWIDGVSVASTTTLTELVDEALYLTIYNTIAGESVLQRVVFGYVTL